MSDSDEKAAESTKSSNEEELAVAEATANLEDVKLNVENPESAKETR
jgi:hypothetical protein